MTEEFAGGQHVCLGGEELIEQASVQFGIEVGAALLDNHQAVIGVGGFAEGGEYDAAGGDADEDGEEEIALADFGKIGAKADLHVDDAHSGDTGALQDAGGAGEQFLILDHGDDAGLSILRKAVRAGSNDSWAGIDKKSRKVFTLIFVTFIAIK